MLKLKKNFTSKNKNFNAEDARNFVDEALIQYITFHNSSWVKSILERKEEIIINAFPSVKSSLYTVFYRFYVANRNPEIQDVFDIMINNSIPYLDFVFTEKFQADIIQKIRSIDKQFSHIEVRTIKELT